MSFERCSKKKIEEKILEGKSISLCFPDYNVYSSAIVGGSIPIALGVAMSIKMKFKKNKVYCFVGDMTSETGIMMEAYKYAKNHNLPIHFVIEDNNLSVCTDTRKTWGANKLFFQNIIDKRFLTIIKYKNKYPHAGAGKRVQF